MSEPARLGEILKTRRQERSLSLKEVENAISVRMAYLEAIEEGQLAKLISPVYAQGFIKRYAAFLELDGERLIREFPAVTRLLNEKRLDHPDFSLGVGSFEVRGSPGGEVKWLPNLLWVGLSVLGLLLCWFIARHFGVI